MVGRLADRGTRIERESSKHRDADYICIASGNSTGVLFFFFLQADQPYTNWPDNNALGTRTMIRIKKDFGLWNKNLCLVVVGTLEFLKIDT